MKEFLFVIHDVNSDIAKFAKVTAVNDVETRNKFAKAFCPFLNFDYSNIEAMTENEDIRIFYSECKDIVVV